VNASGTTVYVAATIEHVIYAVTGGTKTIIAGTGLAGMQNGPAASAQFNAPTDVAVTPTGAILVADENNYCVRSISGGVVSTLAGTCGSMGMVNGPALSAKFKGPEGLDVTASGDVYIADCYNSLVRALVGGTVKTVAGSTDGHADGALLSAKFSCPNDLVVSGGKVYVADTWSNYVRVITQ